MQTKNPVVVLNSKKKKRFHRVFVKTKVLVEKETSIIVLDAANKKEAEQKALLSLQNNDINLNPLDMYDCSEFEIVSNFEVVGVTCV